MSGGKGSKPAGNITTTNLTGQKQEPYLEEVWKAGQGLYNQYTPGSLTAGLGNEWQNLGLNWQGSEADQLAKQFAPTAFNAWSSAAGGGPASQTYAALASGGTNPQDQLNRIANSAYLGAQNYANATAGYSPYAMGYGNAAAQGNLGLSALGDTAQGKYLNANPYMA